MKTHVPLVHERYIYLLAGVISLVLSAFINYRETVINPDAVCYLLSADYVPQGISATMHLCGQAIWPFYSILIYSVAKITHINMMLAAYFIDASFSVLSVLTFIKIIAELGGKKTTLCFAALVILLHHDFNSVRQYIIRDHGYWAFYLLSLLSLLKFVKRPTWYYAVAFSMSLLMATLFRIEGAIFFILLPWLIWLMPRYRFKQRGYYFLMLQAIPLLILLLLAAWMMLHPQQTLTNLGRVIEVPRQLQQGLTFIIERYAQAKAGLAQHVLTSDSYHEAGKLLIALLIIWYLLIITSSLSLPFTVLVLYAAISKTIKLPRLEKWVVSGYLSINLLITFAFLLEHFFLSKRYVLAFTITLAIFVPFALQQLYAQRQQYAMRVLFFLAIASISIASLGGIFDFGYSKQYIHDAGDWLHSHLTPDAKLYANDIQVMYYAQHFGNTIFAKENAYRQLSVLKHQDAQQYDYLALRFDKKSAAAVANIIANIPFTPVQEFSNKRGDRVVIYRKG